ncbi:hypothetical protein BH11PLA1_BH11PLA1_13000 [soil metagenome]
MGVGGVEGRGVDWCLPMRKVWPVKGSGRKRRVLGWVLGGLGVIVLGGWVASRWWWFGVRHGRWTIAAWAGIVVVDYVERDAYPFGVHGGGSAREWSFDEGSLALTILAVFGSWTFWPARFFGYGSPTVYARATLYTLAWPAPLLLGGSAALLLRSGIRAGRRARGGRCVACGYDLGGLRAGAACPECGNREGVKAAGRP